MPDKPKKPVLTPLAIIKPDKPIGEMTDEERRALANRLMDGIAATRKPVDED
jgi:hypothetical protein